VMEYSGFWRGGHGGNRKIKGLLRQSINYQSLHCGVNLRTLSSALWAFILRVGSGRHIVLGLDGHGAAWWGVGGNNRQRESVGSIPESDSRSGRFGFLEEFVDARAGR
jgi:hypothetical protein